MIGFGAIANRLFAISTIAFLSFLATASLRLEPCTCGESVMGLGAPDVELAQFGVDQWIEGEGYVFTDAERLPLVPGTSFGWRLKLAMPDTAVLLREEFVLPAPPAYWGISGDTVLSEDRRVAVTERLVTPDEGWLDGRWTVTPGDPAGAYEMRVFLDGALVRVFRFDAE